jgi:hypothetical protein
MGTGVRVIDRTYGHLVPGSEDRTREKLDARAAREAAITGRYRTRLDVEWTSDLG